MLIIIQNNNIRIICREIKLFKVSIALKALQYFMLIIFSTPTVLLPSLTKIVIYALLVLH